MHCVFPWLPQAVVPLMLMFIVAVKRRQERPTCMLCPALGYLIAEGWDPLWN